MNPGDQTRLNPSFSHRFSHAQIRASYGDLEDAFDRGDYNLVSVEAPEGSELKACATILCGFVERGMKTLKSRSHLSAKGLICSAFGAWWSDKKVEALGYLEKIPANDILRPAADQLADYIKRKEINVFITAVALPILTTESSDERKPIQKYGQFTAKLVGTGLENAYAYRVTEPFDEFLAELPETEKPDFAFSMSPQWFVPKNYARAPIPKILWSHDSDYFLSRAHENYGIYDITIAATSQEHFELSQAFGNFCASNIMSDTLCKPSDEVQVDSTTERDIDVLFTGSSLNAYHTEKARFLYHLAKLSPDRKIVVVDGHLPESEYFDLVSRAKFLPIINRYAGQPSPRWRDALMNRTMLLYPEGTPYSEITAGAFPYRPDAIAEDILHHLEQYDKAEPGTPYDPATAFSTVDRDLAFVRAPRSKQFERQLKFCALMTCWKKTNPRRTEEPRNRQSWLVPSVDCFLFGQLKMIDTVEDIANNLHQDDLRDDRDYCNAIQLYRQICIQSEGLALPKFDRKPAWDQRIKKLNAEGQRKFPRSLLLKLSDAIWEMYDPHGDPNVAAEKFTEILKTFDNLELNPFGADFVIGYSMYLGDAYVFPDYEYGQQVVKESVYRTNPELRPADETSITQILEAAVHVFLAKLHIDSHHHVHAVAHLRSAMEISPNNRKAGELLLSELRKTSTLNASESGGVISEMLDSFRILVHEYPSVLMTELPTLLPYYELLGGNYVDERNGYLQAWERFARMIHFPGQYRDLSQDDARLLNLVRYSQFFGDNFRHSLDKEPEPPRLRSYMLHDLIPKYRTAVQLGAVPGLNGASRKYVAPKDTMGSNETLEYAIKIENELRDIYQSNTWKIAVSLRKIASKSGIATIMSKYRGR